MAVSKNARTSTKGRKLADTGKSGGIITRERIARDLEAFRKAGGRIEVLGNTPVLTRVQEPEPAAAAPVKKKKAA